MRTRPAATRPTAVAAACGAALLAVLATGCGQVGDTAKQAASSAASSVATKAKNAAADKVRQEICDAVGDGKISDSEKAKLNGLAASADAAGLPSEVSDALRKAASSNAQAPKEAVTKLQQGCASATSSPTSS